MGIYPLDGFVSEKIRIIIITLAKIMSVCQKILVTVPRSNFPSFIEIFHVIIIIVMPTGSLDNISTEVLNMNSIDKIRYFS